MTVFNTILDMGPTIMLPLIIFILVLIFTGGAISKALRSGLLVGVAFVGINMVINLLMSKLGPVTAAFIKNTGMQLNVLDAGWPAAAAITWASSIAAFIIPVGILINIILLFTKLTKTVDVDIWNYWVLGYSGAIVTKVTGSLVFGILAFVITEIIILRIADYTAPKLEEHFDLPGISIPHGNAAPFVLLALPLQFLFDRIPGLNKLEMDSKKIRDKFGVFGEPMFIGVFIGIGLSLLARYNVKDTLDVAINLAAVMVILPRMTKILMEGLMPLSEAVGAFLKKRFPGKEFYIGLDSAILAGNADVMATGLVLIPISVLLAMILPGNTVLPLADIVGLPFVVSLTLPIYKGNIIRGILGGIVIVAICLYIGTDLAPTFTQMAQSSQFTMPENATSIVSFLGGTSPITWILEKIFTLFR